MLVAEVTAHGPPEVLRLAERPDPSSGRDEVVVRIRAANVNPTDIAVRSGRHPRSPQPPFVPGWDLAETDPASLRWLTTDLVDGRLRTRVAEVLPLAEAARAHALNEAGGLRGKVVLAP